MKNKLKLELLHKKAQPYINKIQTRWQLLQEREQKIVLFLLVVVAATIVFFIANGLVKYKNNLIVDVNALSKFNLYSQKAANQYKAITKVTANTFNQPNITQIKADVSQVLGVKNPDILIQDGQMTINVASAEFNQVMLLLDQLRRSYGIFPSQVNLIRLSRSGFVSLNASFWVKQ